jgi:preflagellin peptidase FlaK
MIDALRLVLGLVFLGIAALRDMRTRKVPNELWLGMLAIGLVILVGDLIMSDSPSVLLLTPIPVVIIFFVILSEGELAAETLSRGANIGLTVVLVITAVAVLWYQGMVLEYSEDWIRIIHIPIMLLLAYGFYIVRLLHGGADAKALMGLAVLVPFYPVLEGVPLIENVEAMTLVFPFAFVILLNSAIVTLCVPLGYAVYNLSRGDRDGRMFFGYRLKLNEVEKRFVWLMERVEDGEVVTYLFPKRGMDKKDLRRQLKALRKAGLKRVWVTPKIPFMVPMFFGFFISFVIGNLIFGFVDLIIQM